MFKALSYGRSENSLLSGRRTSGMFPRSCPLFPGMLPPSDSPVSGSSEPTEGLAAFEPANWREQSLASGSDLEDQGLALSSDFSDPGYDGAVIRTVWDNGDPIPGNDPDLWRKDQFGAWIHRLDYGKRHSEFGWEICDLSAGRGAGGLAALRPMHWQNYIDQVAALTRRRVTAEGIRNVRKLI